MPGDKGAGAGMSLASPARTLDQQQAQNTQPSVASRALALSSYFLSGALCINLSQILGTPLYLINQQWYNSWIAFTKQSFGLLTMTLTQAFSPTKVIVSGDASVRGQLQRKADGTLHLDFPERLVLIANHQIYTDWLYLWWTAYCSGMHGRLYIILKESLKKIPIIGWGMQLNQFIFLKRDWEQDRAHMAQALSRLNKLTDPMWLLLFPEGTNLAPSTRLKSAKWATKNSIKDMRHCLLPRSTGLRFCLQELRETVDYVYDCTVAYEGVPRGQFAQDIFTLKAGYLEGRPPKSVSMYWRRFTIEKIPLKNEKAFELWLLARWREKDLLIENYLIHGRFPADTGTSRTPQGQIKRGAGHLTVDIRSSHWYEFLQIFAPMGILAMVLYCFYGALPQRFFKSETGRAVRESAQDVQKISKSVKRPPLPTSLSLDSIFDKEKQGQTFGNAGMALAQWIHAPEAKRMMDRVDLVQKWLQDPQKLIVESLTDSGQKKDFLKSLKAEEDRRKGLTHKHQGTFWQDMDRAESTASVQGKKPKSGTFYKELANARANNNAMALTESALKSKANFWDKLNEESDRRAGSVFTLPTLTSNTSDTAIDSMASTSTVTRSSKPMKKPISMTPLKLNEKKTVTPVKGTTHFSTSSTAQKQSSKPIAPVPKASAKHGGSQTRPDKPTASNTPSNTSVTKKKLPKLQPRATVK